MKKKVVSLLMVSAMLISVMSGAVLLQQAGER